MPPAAPPRLGPTRRAEQDASRPPPAGDRQDQEATRLPWPLQAGTPIESARNGSRLTSISHASRISGRIASGSEIFCRDQDWGSGGKKLSAESRRYVERAVWSRRETMGTRASRSGARPSHEASRPPNLGRVCAPGGACRNWPASSHLLSALTTRVLQRCGNSRLSRSRGRRAPMACSRACPPSDRRPRPVRAGTPRLELSGSGTTAPLLACFEYTPADEAGQSATILQFRSGGPGIRPRERFTVGVPKSSQVRLRVFRYSGGGQPPPLSQLDFPPRPSVNGY